MKSYVSAYKSIHKSLGAVNNSLEHVTKTAIDFIESDPVEKSLLTQFPDLQVSRMATNGSWLLYASLVGVSRFMIMENGFITCTLIPTQSDVFDQTKYAPFLDLTYDMEPFIVNGVTEEVFFQESLMKDMWDLTLTDIEKIVELIKIMRKYSEQKSKL